MLHVGLVALGVTFGRRAVIGASVASVASPAVVATPPVRLYGAVDQATCQKLVEELVFADAEEATGGPINLRIQSLGGELMPTLFVLDCLDELRRPVHTYIDGYAASAATLISVSGDCRFMSKRSFVLLHELRTRIEGAYTSVMTDVLHSSELMQMMTRVYLEKTRIGAADLRTLLMQDKWLNADDALRMGVVDSIGVASHHPAHAARARRSS